MELGLQRRPLCFEQDLRFLHKDNDLTRRRLRGEIYEKTIHRKGILTPCEVLLYLHLKIKYPDWGAIRKQDPFGLAYQSRNVLVAGPKGFLIFRSVFINIYHSVSGSRPLRESPASTFSLVES